jgi:hypothetical protein
MPGYRWLPVAEQQGDFVDEAVDAADLAELVEE